MDKRSLTERDICTKFVLPAVKRAGWDEMLQVREEVYFTKGRIIVRGKLVTRGKAKKADFVLYYKPNIPIALIEAKDNNHSVGDGIQQGLDYDPRSTSRLCSHRTATALSFTTAPARATPPRRTSGSMPIVLQDYFDDGSGKAPRYYQVNAVNAAIEAIGKGRDRVLLVMATGTGKTYTAFQIIWRLWKAGRKKRILFLADRNVLIDQTMLNDFRPFGPAMAKLKLHAPRNVIVGGGIFAHANALPCSLAWEAFREANGARSAQEMRARIARYRRTDPGDRSDFEIGCRILTQPFFFDEGDWIPVPASWASNIVSFKTYNTGDADGLALWDAVNERLKRPASPEMAEAQARFGEPQLIRPRLGQGAFRVLVTDIYNRRCAITHERTLPALEAAHIRPYGDGGEHEARNGLLLRRDIHSLFDAGYVTVTPDLHFQVSRRIREEFENGKHYYALHGNKIEPPRILGGAPTLLP